MYDSFTTMTIASIIGSFWLNSMVNMIREVVIYDFRFMIHYPCLVCMLILTYLYSFKCQRLSLLLESNNNKYKVNKVLLYC